MSRPNASVWSGNIGTWQKRVKINKQNIRGRPMTINSKQTKALNKIIRNNVKRKCSSIYIWTKFYIFISDPE